MSSTQNGDNVVNQQKRRNTILMHQNRERHALKLNLADKIKRMKQKRQLKSVFSKTNDLTAFMTMQDQYEKDKVDGNITPSEKDSSEDEFSINGDNNVIADDSCSSDFQSEKFSKTNLVTESAFVDALRQELSGRKKHRTPSALGRKQ